jgi:GH25 family lysozyme M1 (1,4-beta-N-acetylmuramidase)
MFIEKERKSGGYNCVYAPSTSFRLGYRIMYDNSKQPVPVLTIWIPGYAVSFSDDELSTLNSIRRPGQ